MSIKRGLQDPESYVSESFAGLKRTITALRAQIATAAGATKRRQVYVYPGIGAFTSSVTKQTLPITWSIPFADTDYTTVWDIVPPTDGPVLTARVTGKTVNGCTVVVSAGGAAVPSGSVLTLDGIHL